MDGKIWCESELGKGASFFVGFKHWKKPTVTNRLKFQKKKLDLLGY